jgi:hypothetical protein
MQFGQQSHRPIKLKKPIKFLIKTNNILLMHFLFARSKTNRTRIYHYGFNEKDSKYSIVLTKIVKETIKIMSLHY